MLVLSSLGWGGVGSSTCFHQLPQLGVTGYCHPFPSLPKIGHLKVSPGGTGWEIKPIRAQRRELLPAIAALAERARQNPVLVETSRH